MSTVELKEKLISKIQKTKNDDLLEEVYRLLDLEAEDLKVYELNDDQRKAISEARTQIKNGLTISNEQADAEIDEWLNR